MRINSRLKKDRLLFTQNNKKIRLRCPECVRTKKALCQCRVYKNLPALWCHIKRDHGSIANLDFNTQDLVAVLNAVDRAVCWGVIAL